MINRPLRCVTASSCAIRAVIMYDTIPYRLSLMDASCRNEKEGRLTRTCLWDIYWEWISRRSRKETNQCRVHLIFTIRVTKKQPRFLKTLCCPTGCHFYQRTKRKEPASCFSNLANWSALPIRMRPKYSFLSVHA
jgi:hypothetical protein